MMDKLYVFLKECSNEESKKGKAIAFASRRVASLGMLMMGCGFAGIYLNYLGLSDEVMEKMNFIIESGFIVLYIALSVPWILGHKRTPFSALGRYLDEKNK